MAAKKAKKTTKSSKTKKRSFDYEKIVIGVLVICLIGAIGYAVANLDRFVDRGPRDSREVVASVDGDPIYKEEVDKKMKYLQAQLGPEAITWDFTLNHTINQHILLSEAEARGIKADKQKIIDGVDAWFDQLYEQNGPEQLAQILAAQNMTVEEFRNDTIQMYIDDFVVFKLFNETIFNDINEEDYYDTEITDEDVRQYFDENRDLFDRVDASHILVCYAGAPGCESNRTKEEALARIQEVYDKLMNNGDFAELAKEYSDDTYSAAQGGELGEFARGEMVPEFEEAAFALKYPNQISDIIETDYGYHIIMLNSKRSEFEDFGDEISMQLQFTRQQEAAAEVRAAQEAALTDYIANLRDKADIRYYAPNPELKNDVTATPGIMTFSAKEGEICTENGKPVVRLFSTTSCPHCRWIGDTFDETMKELEAQGKVVAYHWELDTEDNTLTSTKEGYMPEEEKNIYLKFNPQGSVPTFVFGCKYYRIGTGYERENNLAMEKAEFKAVVDKLNEELG